MKSLSMQELEVIQGGADWWGFAVGASCAGAALGVAAIVASGPAAPGVAMLQGWALGTAIGTCIGGILNH